MPKCSTDFSRKESNRSGGEAEQKAFEKLREQICKEPVLIQPDQKKQFKVEVDTSNYAIGAILMQWDEKNILHLVTFSPKQ